MVPGSWGQGLGHVLSPVTTTKPGAGEIGPSLRLQAWQCANSLQDSGPEADGFMQAPWVLSRLAEQHHKGQKDLARKGDNVCGAAPPPSSALGGRQSRGQLLSREMKEASLLLLAERAPTRDLRTEPGSLPACAAVRLRHRFLPQHGPGQHWLCDQAFLLVTSQVCQSEQRLFVLLEPHRAVTCRLVVVIRKDTSPSPGASPDPRELRGGGAGGE